MWSVKVDHHACAGKERCLQVCPVEVFDLHATQVRNPFFWLKAKLHGGLQAFPVRQEACIGCMKCVIACPERAIVVDPLASQTQRVSPVP